MKFKKRQTGTETDHWMPGAWFTGRGAPQRHRRILAGNGTVLYFDYGGSKWQ